MTTRCCICGRGLSKVALTHFGKPIGPTCNTRTNPPPPKPRKPKTKTARKRKPKQDQPERCPHTGDLFE